MTDHYRHRYQCPTNASAAPAPTDDYWQEWESSCVHFSIIHLNVMAVDGQTALELLAEDAIAAMQREYSYLGQEAARLVKRYQTVVEGNGGWWVSGLDPLDNWSRMRWGQLKPNCPRPKLDDQGVPVPNKWIKYESPAKMPTRAIFLAASDPIAKALYRNLNRQLNCPHPHPLEHQRWGFWKCVLRLNLPIIICEGAKKAGCLLSHGYPAVALPGIWNGRRTLKNASGRTVESRLIDELAVFATPGRSIIFCFDQDIQPTTQRDVAAAMQATANLFAVRQCVCYRVSWTPEWGKGIDDVAAKMGSELVSEIMSDRIRL